MDVEVSRHLNDVPCAGLPVVRQVHMVLVVEQTQRHLAYQVYWSLITGKDKLYEPELVPTWSPVNVQDPNFMIQVCWSNGKYVTSIVQEDWNYLRNYDSISVMLTHIIVVSKHISIFQYFLNFVPGKLQVGSTAPRRLGISARLTCIAPHNSHQHWKQDMLYEQFISHLRYILSF